MELDGRSALLYKDAQFADALRDMVVRGSPAPIEQAVWPRLRSPLIGDKVIERGFRFRSGNGVSPLSFYGELVDRVFNLNLDTPPAEQPYAWHLWTVRRLDTGEEVIWDNCDFVVALTVDDYHQFVDDDEEKFDPLDRSTWWWEASLKKQESEILARSSSGESLRLWSEHQAKLLLDGEVQ